MNIPKEWLNLEEMCKLINDNIENHIHSPNHKANYVDIRVDLRTGMALIVRADEE